MAPVTSGGGGRWAAVFPGWETGPCIVPDRRVAGGRRRGREAPRAPGRVVKSGPGCCNPLSGGNRVRGGEWPGLGAGGSRSSRGSVAGRGGSRSLEEVVGHLNARSTCFHQAHGRRRRGWVRAGKSALFLSLARPAPKWRREGIPAAPGAWTGGVRRGAASLQRAVEAAASVSDGIAVHVAGLLVLPPPLLPFCSISNLFRAS